MFGFWHVLSASTVVHIALTGLWMLVNWNLSVCSGEWGN